ncbi:MAG TPA: hypothetical protein VJ841_03525 [Candidatus Saccharimonadales bacterium]|nr:hypothetical protein [Candidatus Saccharimonadales bacterium]
MSLDSKKIPRFRLYREIERGEFFVVFGDTAQGGVDKNFTQFASKTKLDIPLVMSMRGVAAEATPYIHQALEWIYDKTGVKPVFAFETNNGGSSEMYRLMQMNNGKYELYRGYKANSRERSDKLGWDTNESSRAKMLGEWKIAFDNQQIKLYDDETIEHHQTFITNTRGRPEADANTHDDGVMSCAGVNQLLRTENPTIETDSSAIVDSGISSFIY